MTIDGEPPPVSTIWSWPPSVVGSPVGEGKGVPLGFAIIRASSPGAMTCIWPGMRLSTARACPALAMAALSASPRIVFTEMGRIGSSSIANDVDPTAG
jgi:hypothetical protein